MRINTLLNDDAPGTSSPAKGPGRGNWSRKGNGASRHSFKPRFDAQGTSQDGASPSGNAQVPGFTGPHGFYLPLNGSDPTHKRTRPLTQHQLAVESYRRRRVDVILDRNLRVEYKKARRRRQRDGPIMRTWIRCKGMPDFYDTDEESEYQAVRYKHMNEGPSGRTRSPPPMFAGLIPLDFAGEPNDHGEEAYSRAKMLGRVLRRMDRWEGGVAPVKKKKKPQPTQGDVVWMDNGEGDDYEGEGDDDQDMEDLDEVDRQLLEAAEGADSEDDEDQQMEEAMYPESTPAPLA